MEQVRTVTTEPLETLISCQTSLIEALDGGDASAIESATIDLSQAVDALRRAGNDGRGDVQRFDYAMRQSHAARIRINCLSEWNCQKIDRLEQLRGIRNAGYASKY